MKAFTREQDLVQGATVASLHSTEETWSKELQWQVGATVSRLLYLGTRSAFSAGSATIPFDTVAPACFAWQSHFYWVSRCHGYPTSSPSELRQLEKQLLRHFRASAVLHMRCCVPVLAGGAARGTSGCFNHFVLCRRLHLLLRANVHRRHRRLALHLQLPQPAASQVRTARGTLLRLPSRRPVPLPLHHPDVPRVCAPRHRPLPRLHQQQAQAGSASGGKSRSGGTQQPRAWTSICHLPAGLHSSAAAAATGHVCFRSSSAAATGHI